MAASATALTDRQRQDLHAAILEYLLANPDRFGDTAAAFKREAGLQDSKQNGTATSTRQGLLEIKWTSVVRLQKKVLELEAAVEQLNAELKAGGGGGGGRVKVSGNIGTALPREPVKKKLSGHRDLITCLALHPVFNIVASASEDATIKIWDHESGDFERTLKGHTNSVQWLEFESKGNILASCSSDLSIKLWDATTEFQCIRTLMGHEHVVSGLVFLPGGERLVSCSRDTHIKVWEVATGFCVKTLSAAHSDWVRKVATNASGALVASCSNDRTVAIWSTSNWAQLASLSGHEHVIECVAFANAECSTAIWKECRRLAPDKYPTLESKEETVLSGYVASGSRDRTVRVWDLRTQTTIAVLSDHGSWVRGIVFHPVGPFLISACEDKYLRSWSVAEGACERKIAAHDHFVTCVTIHSKLPVALTGSADNTIKVWECR